MVAAGQRLYPPANLNPLPDGPTTQAIRPAGGNRSLLPDSPPLLQSRAMQFSLRTLFIITAILAAQLQLCRYWPVCHHSQVIPDNYGINYPPGTHYLNLYRDPTAGEVGQRLGVSGAALVGAMALGSVITRRWCRQVFL